MRFQKGQSGNPLGRRKGTPNKLTSAARSAFMATFGELERDLKQWIKQTAEGIERPVMRDGQVLIDEKTKKPITFKDKADPGKAADLLIRMAEYHFPKLGRTELTGKDGASLAELVAAARSEGER